MGRIKPQKFKPLPRPSLPQGAIEPVSTMPVTLTSSRTRWLIPFGLMFVLACMGIVIWRLTASTSAPLNATTTDSITPSTLPRTVDDLLKRTALELAHVDIGRMNLICARDLPGSAKLDVDASLLQLDDWASRVAAETERNFSIFTKKPGDYNNSEGYFRMLMLITVLQQDLGVHYNMERVNNPDFSNAQDVFISGMIGSTNGGTCSSMPMLYTAIARRLGYPVFIVKAKEHLFCRWDGSWREKSDRFNIEGAGTGMTSDPDDHYMTWPHPITAEEVKRGEYLRSLDPSKTLAMCLAARAYVLEDNGDIPSAKVMYAEAAKRDVRDVSYPLLASRAAKHQKVKRIPFPFEPPPDGDPQALMEFNQRNRTRSASFGPTMPQPWQPTTPRIDH